MLTQANSGYLSSAIPKEADFEQEKTRQEALCSPRKMQRVWKN